MTQKIEPSALRIREHCEAPARCSTQTSGLTRIFLSDKQRAANELVLQWMKEAGMSARLDAIGNAVGRYEGERPGLSCLLLGSHLDTVRDAGKYDGMLGVVSAIECVHALNRRGKRLPFAIEVIGFADEGRRALQLDAARQSRRGRHVRSGAARTRRRSRSVLAIEKRCASEPELVGTVGSLETFPGATNVIPGKVVFTIDIRAPKDEQRLAAVADVKAAIESISAKRKVETSITQVHEGKTAACAPWLMEQIGEAIAAEGLPVRKLPSGAGHDGMALVGLTDIGMLFVRCERGISHNPAETISLEDAEIGARVFLRFIENFRPGKKRD